MESAGGKLEQVFEVRLIPEALIGGHARMFQGLLLASMVHGLPSGGVV